MYKRLAKIVRDAKIYRIGVCIAFRKGFIYD